MPTIPFVLMIRTEVCFKWGHFSKIFRVCVRVCMRARARVCLCACVHLCVCGVVCLCVCFNITFHVVFPTVSLLPSHRTSRWLDRRLILIGFMVDKLSLLRVVLRVLRFFRHTHLLRTLRNFGI